MKTEAINNNSSESLSGAKERVFGSISSSEGGSKTASGAYSLASGCAALLVALYGLQSEIALSVAKAAEYKSQLADQIRATLDKDREEIKKLNGEDVGINSSDDDVKATSRDKLALANSDYNDHISEGQTEQDILSVSSNTLQGYMSQQSQGMQSFIEFMKSVNQGSSFIANLLGR